MDNVLDKQNCTYVPKMAMKTFEYVAIIEVLTLILSNKTDREAFVNEEKFPNGIIGSFIDRQCFKRLPIFSRLKCAITLKFY